MVISANSCFEELLVALDVGASVTVKVRKVLVSRGMLAHFRLSFALGMDMNKL